MSPVDIVFRLDDNQLGRIAHIVKRLYALHCAQLPAPAWAEFNGFRATKDTLDHGYIFVADPTCVKLGASTIEVPTVGQLDIAKDVPHWIMERPHAIQHAMLMWRYPNWVLRLHVRRPVRKFSVQAVYSVKPRGLFAKTSPMRRTRRRRSEIASGLARPVTAVRQEADEIYNRVLRKERRKSGYSKAKRRGIQKPPQHILRDWSRVVSGGGMGTGKKR